MPRPQWTVRGTVGTNGQTKDVTAEELRSLLCSDDWEWPSGEGGGPHTHAQGDVTGLITALAAMADDAATASALAGKAATSHAHAISDTTGLQAAIDGKAATSHTHAVSGITGVTAARVIGSVAGGVAAELTASQVLDLIGSTRGSLIYRGASAWGLLGQGTAGQVLTSGGAGADPTWSNVDQVVMLGSDITNNNAVANTIANVTGLSFQVVNGGTYWFEFTIHYTAALTTTGSRWSITGPSVAFLNYRSEYTLTASTLTSNFLAAYDQPAASNATSLTAGNTASVWGTIKPSADGTVTARFASEVASSAIVAKTGSSVRYRRIG